MRRLIFVFLCVGLISSSSLYLKRLVAATDAGATTRVSLSHGGGNANKQSQFGDMSADGRYVAFASDATDIVAGDTNNASDIFVYDRETGQNDHVSVRSDGFDAAGSSYEPSISDDGRYVAFQSFATNLYNGDTNGVSDIFIHDRSTNQTSLVSFVTNGVANDISYAPMISGNGRYITFYSYASNLVPNDNNGVADVFRYDRVTVTIERVSLDTNEVEGNGDSMFPSISDNGQWIVFESTAANLVAGDANGYSDIFWRDMATGVTDRLSLNSDDVEANGSSTTPMISGDGRIVTFVSLANNLHDDDTNLYQDVFARVIPDRETELISQASNGTVANQSSYTPVLSENGRFVAFQTAADTLVSNDNNGARDIFVYDRQANTITLESVDSNGTQGNFNSTEPVLSGNGRYLLFTSSATNLVTNDTNSVKDIFFHDLQDPPSLSIDYTVGAPGSQFNVSGQNFQANSTAQLSVNQRNLGTITTDGNGNLTAKLTTTTDANEGSYFVTITQGENSVVIHFVINDSAASHPPNGAGITLPNGIGYDEQLYLPLTFR